MYNAKICGTKTGRTGKANRLQTENIRVLRNTANIIGQDMTNGAQRSQEASVHSLLVRLIIWDPI